MNKIAVIGLGLIGGSIALALKANNYYVVGVDNNTDTISYALKNDIIDEACDITQLCGVDVIFVCVPIEKTISTINKVYSIVGDSAIITDVASVKSILTGVKGRIVGGHPMAGTEQSGIFASKRHLFENAFYVLVKYADTTQNDFDAIKKIVDGFKAKIIELDAVSHDRAVAAVSHLPHTIAYSLVNSAYTLDSIVGSGFLDTTRIASSNPDFWTYVCLYNKDNLLNEMDKFIAEFTKIKSYIQNADKKNINSFFSDAVKKRKTLQNKRVYMSEYFLDIDIVDEVGAIYKISSLLTNNDINMTGLSIINSREGVGGALRINFGSESEYIKAKKLLIKENN